MEREVTIIDIAKRAGVSIATVSRVMNAADKVKPETKEKVEQAIRELNYQPNSVARELSMEDNRKIGMLVSDVRNPFYANLFVECERYANKQGCSLILCNYLDSEELELEYYQKRLSQDVCAIIHIGGSTDKVKISRKFLQSFEEISRRIPVVTTRPVPTASAADNAYVEFNYVECAGKLMNYLIGLGHERIAIVGGSEAELSTQQKRAGYRSNLAKNKLSIREHYIMDSNRCDGEGGYLAMRRLLAQNTIPTAVIAINDLTAIGVVQAIKDRKLRVGADISVASFDNTYIAEAIQPELTAVGMDYQALSRALVDQALNQKHKRTGLEPALPEIADLPVILNIRNSCDRKRG